MRDIQSPLLVIASLMSCAAAALHVGCIVFGSPWYRFFGAGQRMERLAAAGAWEPALITAGIAAILFGWSAYALSGADVISRLPYTRVMLCAITAVYLLRGLGGFVFVAFPMGRSAAFWVWSSAICTFVGIVHALGLRQVWDRL